MNQAEMIKLQIASLQEALTQQTPQISSLLREIHKQLAANPDCVTLLSEEEISSIVKGLEKQTNTMLVQETVKSADSVKSVKAKMKFMDLNADL